MTLFQPRPSVKSAKERFLKALRRQELKWGKGSSVPRKDCILRKNHTARRFRKKDRKPMAFLTVNDELSNSIEAIVFPKTYESYHECIAKNKIVVVKAILERKEEKNSLIINEMEAVKYE